MSRAAGVGTRGRLRSYGARFGDRVARPERLALVAAIPEGSARGMVGGSRNRRWGAAGSEEGECHGSTGGCYSNVVHYVQQS